jgi:AAA domain
MSAAGEDIPTVSNDEAVDQPIEGTSPREILVDWANRQDGWARRLAGEVLQAGRAASNEFLMQLYEDFKLEKGLDQGEVSDVPPLLLGDGQSTTDDELLVTRLREVSGVNALVEDADIRFNRGLTVLYGENGAGKTGYVRVLKRVAGVRTAELILANVHVGGPQKPASALIDYKLGETAQSLRWDNEEGLPPFTRVSVFDHRAAALHVDDELNYVFTPADLALFSHVAHGIRAVQDKAAAEVVALSSAGNPFLSRFQRGTTAYPIIESLSAATDLTELDALAALPDAADATRERLQEEIAALKGNTLDERLVAARQGLQSLTRLSGVLGKVAEFNRDAYEVARSARNRLQAEYRRVRAELFGPGELPGDADDEWQQFVASAEEYREHLGLEHYPSAGERCLYCRQQLDEASRTLIEKYRTFLDDSLARQLSDAQRELAGRALRVVVADAETSAEYVRMLAATEPPPQWVEACTSVLDALPRVIEASAAGREITADSIPHGVPQLQATIDATSSELQGRISASERQRADRDAELAKRQRELIELEARTEVKRQLPAIRQYVGNAKRAQKLDQYVHRISNATLRSLTDASKVASEELVNRNFERLFDEERETLRGPQVKLEFYGRSGKAERRKSIANKHRPSTILSEGECKVLALADFLAECRLRDSRAPIIFDDPVTSLDYRRLREVADRIARLVDSHQVIVFTHNIWLTTELLARFERRKDECSFYVVRDTEEEKGLVSAESGPRQDTPAQIAKKIRDLIGSAEGADPAVAEALAEKCYEYIRSWCEAFVEQELLQGVTQRYQPNVMMTRVRNIRPEEIPRANAVVEPIFDKACRYMGGHSQPLEQLSVRPTIAEARQDFETLDAMRREFLSGA